MKKSFSGGIRFSMPVIRENRVLDVSPDRIYLPVSSLETVRVSPGDAVCIGTCVGYSRDRYPVYSGVSGTVEGFGNCWGADGREHSCVIVQNDKKRTPDPRCRPWEKLLSDTEEEELNAIFRSAAVFDTLSREYLCKKTAKAKNDIDTLIVCAVSGDPTLRAFHALVCTYAGEIVNGAKVLARRLGASRILLAVPKDDYDVPYYLKKVIGGSSYIRICPMSVQYPQGKEALLKEELEGEDSAFCVSAETCLSVYKAYAEGVPSASAILSVQISKNKYETVQVPLGTMLEDIYRSLEVPLPSGGFWNGGLVGVPMTHSDRVTDHSLVSVHFLYRSPGAKKEAPEVCIRCGRCSDACPARLLPGQILTDLSENRRTAFTRSAVHCLQCGLCSYVCPESLDVMGAVYRASHVTREEERHEE